MDIAKIIKELVSFEVTIEKRSPVATWSNFTVSEWLGKAGIDEGIEDLFACDGEDLIEIAYGDENTNSLSSEIKNKLRALLDPIAKHKVSL